MRRSLRAAEVEWPYPVATLAVLYGPVAALAVLYMGRSLRSRCCTWPVTTLAVLYGPVAVLVVLIRQAIIREMKAPQSCITPEMPRSEEIRITTRARTNTKSSTSRTLRLIKHLVSE
jgi:hypothetical protein